MSGDQPINFSNLSQEKKDFFKSGLLIRIKEVIGDDSSDDQAAFIVDYLYSTLEQNKTMNELQEMLQQIMQNEEQTDKIIEYIKNNAIQKQVVEAIPQQVFERKNIEIEKPQFQKKVIHLENRQSVPLFTNPEHRAGQQIDITQRIRKVSENNPLQMDLKSIIEKDKKENTFRSKNNRGDNDHNGRNNKNGNQREQRDYQRDQRDSGNNKRVIKLDRKEFNKNGNDDQRNSRNQYQNERESKPQRVIINETTNSTDQDKLKRRLRFGIENTETQSDIKIQKTEAGQNATDAAAAGAVIPGKKKVRCRFYPSCTNQACPFFHPIEECKFFPKCTNGERCIYVHPDCKFGTKCTNQSCHYQHKGKRAAQPQMNPMMQMMQIMMGQQSLQKPRAYAAPFKKFGGAAPQQQAGQAADGQQNDPQQQQQ